MENQITNSQKVNDQFAQQFGGQSFGQLPIPNSTAVLVLGIISIVGCFCYGIIGLILGIIALVLSGKANKIYQENPGNYTEGSLKNLKAGKVCAIVGTSLSGLYLIILVIYLVVLGSVVSSLPWNMMGH